MENNTINLGGSVVGEYVVEVIGKDGTVRRPFGDTPQKNLILDTFFDAIMLNGYPFTPQAFFQSCRIGGGNGSDTPAQRTQTGLQGSQVYISHIGDYMNLSVDTGMSMLVLSRDFKFDINTTVNPVVCREALIGCFGSNISGMDITTSRFVFPSDVIINNGEQLRINYTLSIIVDYLTKNSNITLQSGNQNFTGYIRAVSDFGGIYGTITVGDQVSTTVIYTANADATYYSRNFKTTNSATFNSSSTNTIGGRTTVFGIASGGLDPGFFPTTHTPSVYPNQRASYTASGLTGSVSKYNYIKTDNAASIDLSYYIPAQTTARSVNGVYLWYNSYPLSRTAIYLRFTESNFTTLRTQTINAGTPSGFKIRYFFNR